MGKRRQKGSASSFFVGTKRFGISGGGIWPSALARREALYRFAFFGNEALRHWQTVGFGLLARPGRGSSRDGGGRKEALHSETERSASLETAFSVRSASGLAGAGIWLSAPAQMKRSPFWARPVLPARPPAAIAPKSYPLQPKRFSWSGFPSGKRFRRPRRVEAQHDAQRRASPRRTTTAGAKQPLPLLTV